MSLITEMDFSGAGFIIAQITALFIEAVFLAGVSFALYVSTLRLIKRRLNLS